MCTLIFYFCSKRSQFFCHRNLVANKIFNRAHLYYMNSIQNFLEKLVGLLNKEVKTLVEKHISLVGKYEIHI